MAIAAAYEAGERGADIAERFKVDPSYPRHVARRRGVAPQFPVLSAAMTIARRPDRVGLTYELPKGAWSIEETTRLVELAGAGKNAREAAEILFAEGFPKRTRNAMLGRARVLGICFVGGRRW
ncbi:hypothetical protein GTW51_10125 [Aurantimonas aggregata]|uniref:Uncharacterized protein n=1 Tax=Aurantimonas aggregata TaxID=2047720 RepID=A0A6L9MHB6_9HYPH|nr:hypothetical protein [Aurantimonas aggregata]NDV87058.1 hypothetical protein [Aurantimonas aggregata]